MRVRKLEVEALSMNLTFRNSLDPLTPHPRPLPVGSTRNETRLGPNTAKCSGATLMNVPPSRVLCVVALVLATLRPGRAVAAPDTSPERRPPYERMEFGPALFWTLQVERGNIAYKGIAVRLDPGPGGVSKG